MSTLTEIDQVRSYLSEPGQPFELCQQVIDGVTLQVYRHLPRNLSEMIVAAAQFGDRTFIVNGARRNSYEETIAASASFAAFLKETCGSDARIAIAMRNSPEWVIAFLAIQLAGATAVLINSRGTTDEMLHALGETQCALVVADGRRADALADAKARLIRVGPDGGFFAADGAPLPLAPAPAGISDAQPGDPAIIMFTSGTTGRPKGATLSHRGIATFLFGMRHSGAVYLTLAARRLGMDPAALAAGMPQMSSLAIFPMFHVSGVSAMMMGALTTGGKIVMMDRWDPVDALRLIASERISILQGPPTIFWDILNCPQFADTDVSSIVNVGIGGQTTPPQLLDLLARLLPDAAPGGGYGMTETSGAIASGVGDEYLVNPKASGRLLPGNEVRIVDEGGHDVPLGGIGEVWVRSPLVMIGYWNQPEETRQVIEDGWLKTGDVGFIDANLFITIVDRKKDVIIRGGENIYCAELERVFQRFPGVWEVAAFGVADPRWGERAVLAVMPRPGVEIDDEALLSFGRSRLADYKMPTEVLFTETPFVRGGMGKIDKPALRRAYAANET